MSKGHGRELHLPLNAETTANRILAVSDERGLRSALQDLDEVIRESLVKASTVEVAYRSARTTRNALLEAISLPMWLRAYQEVQQDPDSLIPQNVDELPRVDASIWAAWTQPFEGKKPNLADDQLSYLRIFFDVIMSSQFRAISELREGKPYLIDAWERKGVEVFTTTGAYIDELSKRDELTEAERALVKSKKSNPETAFQQLADTNATNVMLALQLIVAVQRDEANQLTGYQLAQETLNRMRELVALLSAQRPAMDKLMGPGDLANDPDFMGNAFTKNEPGACEQSELCHEARRLRRVGHME